MSQSARAAAAVDAQAGRVDRRGRWRHVALYRWWRQRVVGTVDHRAVIEKVEADSGWTPRYAFMVMMSAGIAVLGLLLSSPAVVIGAMLISPLMSPILGLGFSLALFDFAEMRRAVIALVVGSVVAVAFTALIVLVSPLKASTAEILARTRPNLFDLAVALFAALAGTFAVIRGRGETIVGVAIATALMPPLAVVGYGLATWNVPVLAGSGALFVTNFVTIALSATMMARFYGFGHGLSSQQNWTQTVMLTLVFVAMAVPLGVSLTQIAREAVVTTKARAMLAERFGPRSRVTQLDLDFDAQPIAVRAVVIAPRGRALAENDVERSLAAALDRPVVLQLDEILLDPHATAIDTQRAEAKQGQTAGDGDRQSNAIAEAVALAAGVSRSAVTVDRAGRRATAAAATLPGATLATYYALERRVQDGAKGWTVAIVPPFQPLPDIVFADGVDTLDPEARTAAGLSVWAARRWNATLGIPGLRSDPARTAPLALAERRAAGVAAIAAESNLRVQPLPARGATYRLQIVQ